MKCNTKNRPLTPEQEERQRKHNIRNNEQYLNYISRCLMLSVRNNAGFGAVRLKRFNTGAYDISGEYIREYGMADRISRVMRPCRDRWLGLMRIYFTMDRVAVEKEMRAMLQEFNECGVFEKEVLL